MTSVWVPILYTAAVLVVSALGLSVVVEVLRGKR